MSDEDEIRALLDTYERSLNDSDAALAATCYTTDGKHSARLVTCG
jgi:hypothetical protein